MSGPFRVKRAGRGTWKIVDASGLAARTGYVDRATAATVCRLMNATRRA